jgi:Trypsin-like peptidase domain/TIR domain
VQQAEAIAKPSVVFVQTTWTGWLKSATYAGIDVAAILGDKYGDAKKLAATTSCSGFVANEEGYVVTAGHCVDDQSVRDGGRGVLVAQAVLAFAKYLESRGTFVGDALFDDMLSVAYDTWTIEGQDGGSPPDRVVKVLPTRAAFGVAAGNPLTANVVSVRAFKKGDVALLKVPTDTPWPALEIAPAASSTDGTTVVAAGYAGSVTSIVDSGSDPSMKDGRISGQQTVNGAPFTEISATVGAGMSGGPVVDTQGRVLGTVSWSPSEGSPGFNFMTDTSSIRDVLASNGVSNVLSSTDRAYRTGLADYFAGRYREAAKDFEQVLKLEPNHVQAQNYHRLAVNKSPNEPLPVQPKPKPSGPNPLLFVLIGAGVLVAAAVVAMAVRRRRRAVEATSAVSDAQPPLPPETSAVPAPDAGAPAVPELDMPLAEESTGAPPASIEPDEVAADEIAPEHAASGPSPLVAAVPEQRTAVDGGTSSASGDAGPGSLHLFVTYAREDRALVDRLRTGLQRLRHEVWIDDRLVVGDAWWDVILRQIRQSDAILVAVSPALLQSQASALEREYARRLGKVILPISVRPVRPELMPPDLASLQMVDYSEPDVGAAFELADALAHLPQSPELPDPLPEPPPVPLSYLSDLTARVRAPSLTLDEQLALVARLRSALGKPTEHVPALELLRTLQRREDLYIGPAREIDAILAAEPAAVVESLDVETTPELS